MPAVTTLTGSVHTIATPWPAAFAVEHSGNFPQTAFFRSKDEAVGYALRSSVQAVAWDRHSRFDVYSRGNILLIQINGGKIVGGPFADFTEGGAKLARWPKARGTKRANPRKPKVIRIVGRRWFQKSYGNTYNTATVYVDNVEVLTTPKQYGYGDHYVQVGWEALVKSGKVPALKQFKGVSGHPRMQAEDVGIKFEYYAKDVTRERDL